MRQQLRNAAILGGGSIASVFVGLVTAKIYAVFLGPSGLGVIGLLQALVAFVVPIAGAGVAAVLVRDLAFAIGKDDQAAARATRIAAQRLVLGLGMAAAILLILARDAIARIVLDGQVDQTAVVAVAVAVVATLHTGLWVAVLTGHRRVGSLAKAAAMSSVASGLISVLVIGLGGRDAIPIAIMLAACAASGVTLIIMLLSTEPLGRGRTLGIGEAGRRLLGLGIPVALGTVISGTVQLIVPVVVLHSLGADAVGFFRAASSISVGYLGFLVVAMSQDYYPRLAASADDPTTLARTAYEQQRLIVAVAIPIVMVVLAGISFAIPLLYSASFAPASDILETQLIGDLLKLPSWTFAFILIVQHRRAAYVGVELVAALLLLSGVLVGVQLLGLPGVGLAYLATYLVYYPLTYVVARRSAPLTLNRAVQGPILFALAASVAVVALPHLGFESARLPAAILAAVASGVIGARMLIRDLRSPTPPSPVGTR